VRDGTVDVVVDAADVVAGAEAFDEELLEHAAIGTATATHIAVATTRCRRTGIAISETRCTGAGG
jgi:hypothetical protein